MADRFSRIYTNHGHGDVYRSSSKRFNGYVVTHPDRLSIPLKTRKPTVFAVWNDLFHEAVPEKFIFSALNIMEGCAEPPPWGEKVYRFQFDEHGQFLPHRFLILTKRPERMASVVNAWRQSLLKEGIGVNTDDIWFGLTVCNQEEADSKIPEFLKVPGKKFLSIEPMLGPIGLVEHVHRNGIGEITMHGINAVILGGETGPGARPLHPDWVRSVRDQCQSSGVPFFFKQWGEWLPADQEECPPGPPMKAWMWSDGTPWTGPYSANAMESKGHKLLRKVGREKAGRLLDGRTHDELPWVKK